MAEPTLKLRHLYPGVPNTVRGEPTHFSVDPTGQTDNVVYPSGRVAVLRSLSDPLSTSVFSLHSAPVTATRFSPDAKLIASGDDSGVIRLWIPEGAVPKSEFQAFPGAVKDISFSPDGKFIVACGECRGALVKVLKVPGGGSAGIPKGHSKSVIAIDAGASKFIASASEDMTVGLFAGPPVREFDVPKFLRHHTAFVNDVRFSPDGSLLAIASSDRSATVVDVASQEIRCTLTAHTASVTGVYWLSADRLVTSSNDKSVKVWTIPEGECVNTFTYGTDVMDMQVGCATSVKTGEILSVSLRPQINIRHPSKPDVKRVMRGHCKQIVGLSAVGDRFYSADYSGLIVAWQNDVGAAPLAFNGKGPANSVCAIAANAEIIANVGQDGKIYVTSADTLTYKKPVTVKGGGKDIAVGHACSPELSAVMVNETRLVAVNTDGTEVIAELKFDNGETGSCVALSPDASLIAVGFEKSGGAGELRFYTLNGSSFAKAGDSIRAPSAPNRLAFSNDGEMIAVGEKSRRVKMYNTTMRSEVTGGGVAHTARVDAVCFSPDGSHVASGGMDGSVAVWPVGSEDEPIRLKTAHRSGVTGIAFTSPECVVTSGGDACIRSWNI